MSLEEVNQFAFLFGTTELLLILLIGLLLFGSRIVPALARNISSSTREVRNSLKEGIDEKNQKQRSPAGQSKTLS